MVLAVAQKVLPVQHAIVSIGGVYYDPTWEINASIDDAFNFNQGYLIVDEWDKPSLNRIVLITKSPDGNYYAPMFSTVRKLLN